MVVFDRNDYIYIYKEVSCDGVICTVIPLIRTVCMRWHIEKLSGIEGDQGLESGSRGFDSRGRSADG